MGSIHRISCQVCSNFHFQFDFPSSASLDDWQLLAPGCEFEFEAPVAQVTMPLKGSPAPKSEANLEFLVARTRCHRKPGNLEADETAMQVRELIMSQPGRPCTTENIARRLDISPRTLRQHLASAGTIVQGIAQRNSRKLRHPLSERHQRTVGVHLRKTGVQ